MTYRVCMRDASMQPLYCLYIHVLQGDRVRIYFGNAGPNLISSFHVIGTIFDKVGVLSQNLQYASC